MMNAGLALVLWTCVMWFWLYATRLPAVMRTGKSVSKMKHMSDLGPMPPRTVWVSDNFSHLFEQPVLFYFLVIYAHLSGLADPLNATLAWAYVASRVVHSIVQCTTNFVPLRFVVFVIGSAILMIIAVRCALAMFL